MMQNTREIIELYYQHFNQADMNNMLALLDDQIEHDVNQGERQTGKKLFASFMDRMNRCYKEQVHHINIMVNHDGTRAAAEFIVDGSYLVTDNDLPAANGQQYSIPCGAFFEVHQGKITRVTNYYNLNAWLKQVGA